MSSVLKALFGGSDSSQTSQSTSTPVDLTPDAYKGLQQPLADTLKSLLASGGSTYSGPLTTPETGTEQNVLTGLGTQTGPNTARSQYLDSSIAGNYLPGQGGNPFLDAAIKAAQRPTLEGLQDTLSRSLPGTFTQAGQFIQPNNNSNGGSSPFDTAAALATRGAANAIGDIATKMSSDNYNTERDRQQQSVALSQNEVDATIKNLQAQALPRLIQENGIERGMALFQQQTQQLLDLLKTIGAVSSPTIANQSQSTGEATSSSSKGIIPGLFPKGLGGGSGSDVAAAA